MKRKNKSIFIVIFALMIMLGFSCAFKAMGSTNNTYRKVTVYPGDTLWDIAKDYGSDKKDIRKVVYEIKKANKLNSSILIPGQELIIPIN